MEHKGTALNKVSRMRVMGVCLVRRKESSQEKVPVQREKASLGFLTQACTDTRTLSESSEVFLYTQFS